MFELALDGQCDSPGRNATYNTLSTIDTATNKWTNFRVVHVKVCNYSNETTHYVRFCNFCILRAQGQCHNIKTTLKLNGNYDIYIDARMFWQKFLRAETFVIFLIFFPFSRKFLSQVPYTFLRGTVHLKGRQNFMRLIIMHMLWALKHRKYFFASILYRKALALRWS